MKHPLWQQQKFVKQIQQRKNYLLTAIFKRTMGIYTHIDDVVSRDKHGICDWASRSDAGETCVTGCQHCLLAHDFTQFGGYQ